MSTEVIKPGATNRLKRAIFQRHYSFGYECFLDESVPSAATRKARKVSSRQWMDAIVVGAAFLLLATAGGLLAMQPAVHNAIGSITSRLFGGGGPSAAGPASAAGNSLALGGQAPPTPSVQISPDGTINLVSGAAPVSLTGSLAAGTSAVGTVCPNGTVSPGACTWHVSIKPGQALHSTLVWSSPTDVQLIVTDPDGHPLGTQTAAPGSISIHLDTPPPTVFITGSVTRGASTTFTLQLADHTF